MNESSIDTQKLKEVYDAIPHREPFLFIDSIEDVRETGATAKRQFRSNEAYFAGHYPGNPIVPGVLLCEAVFQTAAVFFAKKLEQEGIDARGLTPMLSRIKEVKFKNQVKPGDTVIINVDMVESVGQFHFIKGTIHKGDQLVLSLEGTLALVDERT